uniref:ADF-H domain-containing protein n=1 Tax=Stereomyxa ramosa TaxID=1078864 RepID=A0A7S2EY82_9EUKA|eukprot:CAMPEP_0174252698 /NCGR_PEP_ID=MMETSP0439-20130205/2066_1 /TAXON_ID=0 /ORGANISM="Stereomyxa ramosa, Strain Chinc5" /LENGTH=138 /DNA_ID=CAMNT_0015333279 /DNA_START=49 /DNA_END=465 /DNA_ORIENTATION=-
MSGIAISADVQAKFQEMKLGHCYRYIIFRMSDDLTEVIVEKTAPETASYDDFVAELPENDCRYALYDYEADMGSDGIRNKLCFVLWCPDSSRIKPKMLYTSTKESMKKVLVGINTEIQATDYSEIAEDVVKERAMKFV